MSDLYIFEAQKEYCGFALSAVVSAKSKERALELLDWEVNEDTTQVAIVRIGISEYKKEAVHAEESL